MSVDELLGADPEPEVKIVPEQERDTSKLILRILVDSTNGDKVRVNLPLAFVQAAMDIGLSIPQVVGKIGEDGRNKLADIDWMKLFALVEKGVIGKLVEVESANGDTVSITVE